MGPVIRIASVLDLEGEADHAGGVVRRIECEDPMLALESPSRQAVNNVAHIGWIRLVIKDELLQIDLDWVVLHRIGGTVIFNRRLGVYVDRLGLDERLGSPVLC